MPKLGRKRDVGLSPARSTFSPPEVPGASSWLWRRAKVVDPEVSKAILEIAADIEDQIRKFNTMKPDQPGYYELGNDIRNRFKSWSQAWWTVHRVTGVDGRPPLDEILRLASVQKESGHMQEVVLDAEAHLGGLTPAAK